MKRSSLFALLVTLGAASTLNAQSTERPLPMLVSPEWVAERLADPGLVIVQIDQRRDGYDGGHLPGARYLPYSRIAAEVDGIPVELLPVEDLRLAFEEVGYRDGVNIVLYGAPLSAARAWMTLDYLGVSDRAAILDGGLTSWRAAGLPVSTEQPPAPPEGSRLTVRPQPHRVVPAEVVVAKQSDPGTLLVDARPLVEYTGEDNGQNGRYLAGHIPGARHLHWEDLIHSTADPRLHSIEELRRRFEAVGAREDRAVLVYCMVGMRASMAYFVSRLLGYETYLYDGSWADWSARGLPVEAGADPLSAGG